MSFLLLGTQKFTLANNRLYAGQTLTLQTTGTVTSDNGFTNDGTIRLFLYTAPQGNLTVGGTLTNGPTGLIDFPATTYPVFNGDLVNHGTVAINYFATFPKNGGNYYNDGQFNVSGQVTINTANVEQAGGTFQLNGGLALNSTTFRITGGAFNVGQNAGGVTIGDGSSFVQEGGVNNYNNTIFEGSGTYKFLGGTIGGGLQLDGPSLEIGPLATAPASFSLYNQANLSGNIHAGQSVAFRNGGYTRDWSWTKGFNNDGTLVFGGSSGLGVMHGHI